jgi:hypothetical protein
MSFDDLMLWLVTAMSLTAVVFLVWTLAALIRKSGPARFAMESEPARGCRSLPAGIAAPNFDFEVSGFPPQSPRRAP